jgi:hypothetical protein
MVIAAGTVCRSWPQVVRPLAPQLATAEASPPVLLIVECGATGHRNDRGPSTDEDAQAPRLVSRRQCPSVDAATAIGTFLLCRAHGETEAAPDREPPHGQLDVGADRRFQDIEPVRNVGVSEALGDQPGNLALARRQRLRATAKGR